MEALKRAGTRLKGALAALMTWLFPRREPSEREGTGLPRLLYKLGLAVWWGLCLPFRLLWGVGQLLRKSWRNRRYRRFKDLPIAVTFVLYTLTAALIGTLVMLAVFNEARDVRSGIDLKYVNLSETHVVPEKGRYAVRNQGSLSTFTIYDEDDVALEQFTVDHRRQLVSYDVSAGSAYLAYDGEDGEDRAASFYGPNGFVVTPRYSAADRSLRIASYAAAVLSVPLSYGGMLILCAVLFYRRKLKKPFLIIRQGSARIARNDLDFTVSYDSRNELGQLVDSFENMRGALAENNRELWRSMEERKRLNAAFSHDLRTPLTVLKGHVALLTEAVEDGADRAEIAAEVDAMSGSITRMERYVDAMASLQRLEDVEARREDVPFDSLTESLRDTAQILCAGKTLRFEAASDGPRTVRVDREIVQQVFENVLANGTRYARSALEVDVRAGNDGLSIDVRDDGPGFSAVDLEKATQPFYRNKAEAGNVHLGLGLNICKILCQRHGGDICLSNAPQGGALVRVRFCG